MDLQPIGVVRSSVSEPEAMPFEGVPARVELFPQFADGLVGIAEGTHLQVLGWLHLAGRDVLTISRTRSGHGSPRGVFALRSSHRPNPLSLTTCRLEKVEGLTLYVERLDLVDGTPIVDIKRYSPSWDCVFSARSSRDLRVPRADDRQAVLDALMVEAANFHGERCPGAALGVRLMHHAMAEWRMAQKDPGLVVHMGDDGCIADALQGLTGATLGNGRMKVPSGRAFRLSYDRNKVMAFLPSEAARGMSVEEVLEADVEKLFSIRRDVHQGGDGGHGSKAARSAPAPEKQALLLDAVQSALVDGTLPCAVAHVLAERLGVGVPDVGWAADAAKVRITRCQLGCFR